MSTCGAVQEKGADYEQDNELFGRAKSIETNRKANRQQISGMEMTRTTIKERI